MTATQIFCVEYLTFWATQPEFYPLDANIEFCAISGTRQNSPERKRAINCPRICLCRCYWVMCSWWRLFCGCKGMMGSRMTVSGCEGMMSGWRLPCGCRKSVCGCDGVLCGCCLFFGGCCCDGMVSCRRLHSGWCRLQRGCGIFVCGCYRIFCGCCLLFGSCCLLFGGCSMIVCCCYGILCGCCLFCASRRWFNCGCGTDCGCRQWMIRSWRLYCGCRLRRSGWRFMSSRLLE